MVLLLEAVHQLRQEPLPVATEVQVPIIPVQIAALLHLRHLIAALHPLHLPIAVAVAVPEEEAQAEEAMAVAEAVVVVDVVEDDLTKRKT